MARWWATQLEAAVLIRMLIRMLAVTALRTVLSPPRTSPPRTSPYLPVSARTGHPGQQAVHDR